jgi:hypothetical protein
MRERLPSLPSVPRAGVRFLQGLVNASVRSDGVSCLGMLDAISLQVVQGALGNDGLPASDLQAAPPHT